MSKQAEYETVHAWSLETLKHSVERLMKEGYRCQGGLTLHGSSYYQTMIKEIEYD